MASVGVMPLGLAAFFSAAAMMEGGQTTHPLSGSRVEAIARGLEARPRAFVDPSQPNPEAAAARLLANAREIRAAVPIIDDPELRASLLRGGGSGGDFAGLRSAHERLCTQ
jgi:hypothetical protein